MIVGQDPRDSAWRAAEWFASKSPVRPQLALVLGSGLAGALHIPEPDMVANLADIPGLIGPSVVGHPGRLVVGRLHGLDIAVFEGRIHFYEGFGAEAVRLTAAFMARVGVRAVLLTSSCGGLVPTLRAGDFVVVRDHLVYPLGGPAWVLGRTEAPQPGDWSYTGKGRRALGSGAAARGALRGGVYCPRLSATLERACTDCGAGWHRGVLGFSAGPCYESPAEARALRMAGADIVSMSAAADALAAKEEGLEVACFCCVTNAVGLWKRVRAGHESVLDSALSSAKTMGTVLDRFVQLAALGGMG